jgi:hypothetical protein
MFAKCKIRNKKSKSREGEDFAKYGPKVRA